MCGENNVHETKCGQRIVSRQQGANDKLFFISADMDIGQKIQISYELIRIKYQYTIFHIGRYRN